MLNDIVKNGENAEALAFPMKYFAWDYLQSHATRTWHDVLGAPTTRAALERLMLVPSLGIVKSAFVLQFLGHDIGCLDTRNLRREGINMNAFKCHSVPASRRGSVAGYTRQQMDKYVLLAGGRAEELWDTWCREVARARPHSFDNAEAVSALHLTII
jgi:hypothetical protein